MRKMVRARRARSLALSAEDLVRSLRAYDAAVLLLLLQQPSKVHLTCRIRVDCPCSSPQRLLRGPRIITPPSG